MNTYKGANSNFTKKRNLEEEVSLKPLPHNDNALPFARGLSCFYFTAKRHKTHEKVYDTA